MPKLKYKEHKKEKSRHHSSRKSSKKEKPYKPPTLYEEEEGWVPRHHDDEAAWRQHMFEAMMDDEGQDPFYTGYEHVQPTPVMTDEEHRQHIVSGMYKRTHAEEIAAEEKRQAHKEKKRQERQREKDRMAQEDAERIRAHNVYKQLQTLKDIERQRKEYVDKWAQLERRDEIGRKDIPWPVVDKRDFSLDSVKAFLVDPKLSSEANKKTVRKEQTRYHPDKFITRYIKKLKDEREKERVVKRVNEVSGWLNELWTQINA